MAKQTLLLALMAACGSADAQPQRQPAAPTPPNEPLFDVDTQAVPPPAAGSQIDGMLKSLHVRVCVRADVAPFASFGDQGLRGFDIALATEIIDQLSIDHKQALTPTWVVVSAAERMQRLQDGACDFMVAAFSLTPQRAQALSTSKVYLQTDKVLLGAAKITRKQPVIAQLEGATGTAPIAGTPRTFRTYQEIIHAMDMGEVDYVATDRPIAEHLMRSTTTSFSVTKELAKNAESYVVASGKQNKELATEIDRALTTLAYSGRLALLERRWL
jgi:ABC-type amino acid transport substrate-binding protein